MPVALLDVSKVLKGTLKTQRYWTGNGRLMSVFSRRVCKGPIPTRLQERYRLAKEWASPEELRELVRMDLQTSINSANYSMRWRGPRPRPDSRHPWACFCPDCAQGAVKLIFSTWPPTLEIPFWRPRD